MVAPDEENMKTNWQESVSDLSTLLTSETNSKTADATIEKTCATILNNTNTTTNINDDNAAAATPLPSSIRTTITTIYLRALIKLGKYGAVVDYCQNENDQTVNVEEQAYSLYRLQKYDACRQLCVLANSSSNSSSSNNMGLLHIHAQALYRLGETNDADAIYRRLLFNNGNDNDDPTVAMMDVDEREDALSNALANCTANYTPGSYSSSSSSWLEQNDTLEHLIKSYATATANTTSSAGDEAQDGEDGEDAMLLQNYDLAYNLATYLLVSSDARDQSHILQAKRLLEHAETSALTILESSSSTAAATTASPSPEEGHDDDEAATAAATKEAAKEAALKKKQQQAQQQLAEREAGPIRANLALAKLLLGGEANEMDALRGYLTLVTKAAVKNKKGGGGMGIGGGGGGVEANLVATASNNLALLRDGKESVFDVIKRIPTTSSLSVSEDAVASGGSSSKGGKEKGGGNSTVASSAASSATMVVPLVGATPQQVRIALFNRALLFAKMGHATGCLEALDVLRASLLVSYHGDDNNEGGKKKTKKGEAGGGGGPGSPKRNKGKKKKGASSSSSSAATTATSGGVVQDVPTAKPASKAEAIAWSARADWLESELYRVSQSKEKSSEDILNNAIAKLDEASKGIDDDGGVGVLPFTKAQLLLHKAAVKDDSKSESLIKALESLPPSMRSCPGTVVTLASLYESSSSSQAEKLLSSLGDGMSAKLAMAEFQMEKGKYEDAVELLQGIVEDEGGGSEETMMEVTALLVKALSYTDPSKAEEYVGILQEAMEGGGGQPGELDGDALESMDIPRFAKKALGTSASSGGGGGEGSSSKVRKLIAATGGKGRSNLGERTKKNRESILRKRATQREAYLSRLESEGG
ncbi:hypothetical protein ACHAXR_004734, partial [Thalassiosira sp. AJA248-18]